jgi:replicative DNA helicase
MERQEEIVKDLSKLPLLIQDDIGRDAEELLKFIPRIQPQPDIIFIDHLQQISTRKYGGNLTPAIQEYMHIVKDLALSKNFAMVVISQLSRNVSDGTDDGGRSRPSLKDLKWSGAIEEIADVVNLLWYPDNENGMSIIVAKQRNGPLGTVKAKFYPKNFRFEDIKETTKVYNKGDSRRQGEDY